MKMMRKNSNYLLIEICNCGGDCLKTHSIKKRLRLFYIINTVSLVISKNFRNFIAV